MLIDSFCEKCTLQFDNKHLFDLHLSLVHGEKIKMTNEPVICEEKFQGVKKTFQTIWWKTISNVTYAIVSPKLNKP